MLSKCATMQALRAGWPDQFGALYAEEELDRAKVEDRAASEIVEREREEQRLRAIAGKDCITVSWGGWELENVRIGAFADRVLAWLAAEGRSSDEVSQLGGGEPRGAPLLLGQVADRCARAEEGDRSPLESADCRPCRCVGGERHRR